MLPLLEGMLIFRADNEPRLLQILESTYTSDRCKSSVELQAVGTYW